ncbi:MAG: hypothetical protein OEQ53_19510 [Saprospiraceae bacterium]|nr:hypothetical protein [Saprospiraceae bacterium]
MLAKELTLNTLEDTIEDPEAIDLWSLVNVMHQDYDGFLQLFEKAVDLGFYPYPAFRRDPILVRHDNTEFQHILEKAKRKHNAFKERNF